MNFFKKAKNLIIPKSDFEDQLQKTVNKLGDSFFEQLENVLKNRKEDSENSHLTQEEIDAVIKDYTKKNMAIAAGAAAAPGPLGVVAMVFEITSVVGNQLKMTYDIACAYDKEDLINRDLLIDIPLHAYGIDTNLDKIQNLSSDDIAESGLNALKEKSTTLAKEIANKSVKKSMVKFIPIAGSVMMAVWTKSNTKKVSDAAIYFFDNKKTLVTKEKTTQKVDPILLQQLHIQILLNLMKADSLNSEEEITFIRPMIENSDLSDALKEDLTKHLETDYIYEIDFQQFKTADDEKEALLTDMIILYKRDGEMHADEIKYIHHVGKEFGYEKEYINDLMET